MYKSIIIILLLLVGGFISYLVLGTQDFDFKELSPEKMYQKIIEEKWTYSTN